MIYENTILNSDCMSILPTMDDNSVNLTLTDIPYNVVNRDDNGLRNLHSRGGGRHTHI